MAVEPPLPLVEQLRSLDRPDRTGLRWTPPHQWHVTLRFLAEVDPDALSAALSGLEWPHPVEAEAGPAPCSLSSQVWMLPVAGLDGLAGAVIAATAGLQEPEHRRFRGHLTLARARPPKSLRGLPAPPVSATWSVREVVGFRSELRPTGAHHQVIGRWPVGPG